MGLFTIFAVGSAIAAGASYLFGGSSGSSSGGSYTNSSEVRAAAEAERKAVVAKEIESYKTKEKARLENKYGVEINFQDSTARITAHNTQILRALQKLKANNIELTGNKISILKMYKKIN